MGQAQRLRLGSRGARRLSGAGAPRVLSEARPGERRAYGDQMSGPAGARRDGEGELGRSG